MGLDSMRGRLASNASREDLPVSKEALNPAVIQAIAEGFAIEHGQKITNEYIQQLTTANAQYYVSLARNARAEQGHNPEDVAADGGRSARSHRFRSKRKVFGFAGAGMAALVLAIIFIAGGSDGATKAPTSLTNKVVQNGLTDSTSAASQATSSSAETVPTDPSSTPASSSPTPSPSPTPAAKTTTTPNPSPSPSPTPTPDPTPNPTPDPSPTPTPTPAPVTCTDVITENCTPPPSNP